MSRRIGRRLACLVVAGVVLVVGNGVTDGLWWDGAVRLWDAARLAPGTVLGAGAIAAVLGLVWRASR